MYLICPTPEPEPSLEESVTETALAYQPEQAPPLQEIELVGALESAVTVKGVFEELVPAPLVA